MRVAVLDDYHHAMGASPAWERLRRHPAIDEIRVLTEPLTGQALAEQVGDVEILVAIRERTRFPADVLASLPKLQFIAQTGNHVYHIDVEAATRQGVAIGLYRGASGGSVGAAELTIGLLLTLWRQIATYDQLLHHGGWTTPYGRVLQGKTIGLLGLGRVGSHVSRLAHAFGMQVLAWSPHLDAARARQVGAEATDLESLLRRSDVVSVHLTLSDSTRDLLDGKRLDLMPRGALLINTARGPIVNEQALVARLRSGHLGGAGLDVFDQEPLPPDHPLRHLPNVVLTPHAGWPTDAAYISFAETAVQLVEEFLAKDPSHLVNPQALETGRQGR